MQAVVLVAAIAAIFITGALMSLIQTAVSIIPSIVYFVIFITIFGSCLTIGTVMKFMGMFRTEPPKDDKR